jgi:hypothetical protein
MSRAQLTLGNLQYEVMADIEAPYSTHDFNQLPGLPSAHRALQPRKAIDSVKSVVRPLIIKCQLKSVLGIVRTAPMSK